MAVLYLGNQRVTPMIVSGSGTPSGKYQLLQRIKDDSNNEIGTVSSFFTDANNVEYAVVCLDAQYRLASGYICSNDNVAVTNLPLYSDAGVYSATETSTFNTQKIVDFCSSNNLTTTACSHCHSKSFNIDNTTYYGQLPSLIELIDILGQRININNLDISASSYSSLIVPSNTKMWSSCQYSYRFWWSVAQYGRVDVYNRTTTGFICPVLELPNA